MQVGYGRTSTTEQHAGLEAQVRDLQAAGCERVFTEQVSSVAERAQLAAALDFARDGDVFMVTKPDRLARNTADLLGIVAQLEAKGVGLVVLSMGKGERLDTRNPTSKLMLTILAGVASWEREIMLERQREGIAKAKADGKYQGRAPTARNQSETVLALLADGVAATEVAKRLGIGRASVYRIKAGLPAADSGTIAA